ncbi:MAG: DnaJ domain-containing protein [Christensenellaceae bacterium]|nr:DnaJ domain-containing protein [Christensenellaceae bacterium]
MDPYKVLGVESSASDDEVKRAYRNLVKQNHPDKFQDPVQKARATEKIKQINAAYDEIQAIRSGKSSGGSYGGGAYSNYEGYQGQPDPKYAQVYAYINSGNIAAADAILERMADRDAEWHYLKGIIYMRQQWFDAARRELELAVRMDPNNMRYRQAYQSVSSFGGYRNYYGTGSSQRSDCDACDICTGIMCADCLCSTLRCC